MKNEREVSKLVAGARGYICDECVAIASQIMENDSPDNGQTPIELTAWRKLLNSVRRFFNGDARRVQHNSNV